MRVLMALLLAVGVAHPALAQAPVSAPFDQGETANHCDPLFSEIVAATGEKKLTQFIESSGNWRTVNGPEPFEFLEADIDHDGTSDLIYRLRYSRSAQAPLFTVEYDIVLYRLDARAPAEHDLAEVLRPIEDGGAFVRLEMDALQGGPRPYRLTDTVRMYSASIIELNDDPYIILLSPPVSTLRNPSIYLINFESGLPYVACRFPDPR